MPDRSARVLVVEDERLVSRVTCRMLEHRGHTVQVVETAAQALAAMQSGGYDVVLCDVGLPDMDGLKLSRRLESTFQIPVVIMSGSPAQEGYGYWLNKPFSSDTLMAVLGLAMDGTVV